MTQRYSLQHEVVHCHTVHKDDFVLEATVLLFVPWKKVVSQKLNPKGAYQLSSHYPRPKHDSTTSLLTSFEEN